MISLQGLNETVTSLPRTTVGKSYNEPKIEHSPIQDNRLPVYGRAPPSPIVSGAKSDRLVDARHSFIALIVACDRWRI